MAVRGRGLVRGNVGRDGRHAVGLGWHQPTERWLQARQLRGSTRTERPCGDRPVHGRGRPITNLPHAARNRPARQELRTVRRSPGPRRPEGQHVDQEPDDGPGPGRMRPGIPGRPPMRLKLNRPTAAAMVAHRSGDPPSTCTDGTTIVIGTSMMTAASQIAGVASSCAWIFAEHESLRRRSAARRPGDTSASARPTSPPVKSGRRPSVRGHRRFSPSSTAADALPPGTTTAVRG